MIEKEEERFPSTLMKTADHARKQRFRIPLAKPVFNKEMEKAPVEAFWDERFISGESVAKFEEEFASYRGVDCAVSVRLIDR